MGCCSDALVVYRSDFFGLELKMKVFKCATLIDVYREILSVELTCLQTADKTPREEGKQPVQALSRGDKTSKQAKKQFDQVFAESVVRGLSDILGDSCAKALLYYMERTLWQKGPLDPELFSGFLQKTFGWGARIIERHILDIMYSKLGLSLAERDGARFTDYIDECRSAWAQSKK